jgi:hypothetical protein
MMIPPKALPVSLASPGKSKVTLGEIQFQEWDAQMRMRRALKIWGTCWGIAVVTVFIPGMHFILVPSFLLGGPIAAYRVYQQTSTVLGGTGVCPSCGQEFKIARSKPKWPINDVCDHCRDAVIVSLDA